ncbi:ribonuclease H-like domain-containing protein, partial [Tanacetum coccineum]
IAPVAIIDRQLPFEYTITSRSTDVVMMKNYVELERLGYVLPQDLTIGLILNGLTSDFVGFVRNYNMHNIGKTVGELHAMLIEYEKGLPKKAETPQVMMIKGGKIQKSNKNSLKAKGKDRSHYAPSIIRGVVSVHRLVENGYVQCFTDYGILVSKNNVFYFNVIPSNGIYEIDMHDLVPNDNSIYNISTKRAKHNLGSTYLWHCRLAHISKKRIKKLQQEGISKSTMSYLINAYLVYLVFKNEVKNQPGKTIKALRSDRDGKYISQEFKDYLKACGIVQQLTPSYTPQHNGDYALESATRILNIVPTKKVDKTPYELWYGKVPNLSYLMVLGEIPMEVEGFEPPQEEVILNPSELHWTAVKNILKYLRNTKDMFLVYGGNPEAELRVDCYCDTGFEIDIDDMKSHIGYLLKKQRWKLFGLGSLFQGLVWLLEDDGRFTVKSLSRITDSKFLHEEEADQETLWNKCVPKKVNIFIWRALRRRLLVRCELDKRGIDLDKEIFRWWKIGLVNAFTTNEILLHNGGVVVPNHLRPLWQTLIADGSAISVVSIFEIWQWISSPLCFYYLNVIVSWAGFGFLRAMSFMFATLPHPGQGILGPAPTIYASQPTPLPSAFSTMPLQDPTWHMDTCASSHLNFNASNLSTIFDKRLFPSVHVGDGKSIPVTNTGHSIIPSHHRPLHLHNVLVTPNIIKNLISVRQFTRDNNCTIEFDAFGFSVKDYLTRHILLRCDSSSDLYPVTKPSTSPIAFLSTSASTWHQRLGHPGYPAYHRGFRCLNLETNKIILSRHVTFDETQFPYKSMTPSSPPSYTFLDTQRSPLLTSLASKLPNPSTNIPHQTSIPTAPPITDPTQSPPHTGPNSPGPTFPTNQPTSHEPNNIQTQTQNNPLPPPIFDPPNPQTNTNPVNEPPCTNPMITWSQSSIVKPIERLSLHTSSLSPIPKSPFTALKDPNWCNAMYDKYNASVKNGTWILVPSSSAVNLVRSMWLFKHTFHADGTLSRYKARLVSNGSNKQHGVDFDETFSPVVKSTTIRTRSLYGLKEAPRAWFQRFTGYATRASFSPSRCDSSLFIYTQGSHVAYLLIYVDDIILTASSPVLLQRIIDSLHKEFDMTDLGVLNYFLGISAVRHLTGLFLSQKKYARQLLQGAPVSYLYSPRFVLCSSTEVLAREGEDEGEERGMFGEIRLLGCLERSVSFICLIWKIKMNKKKFVGLFGDIRLDDCLCVGMKLGAFSSHDPGPLEKDRPVLQHLGLHHPLSNNHLYLSAAYIVFGFASAKFLQGREKMTEKKGEMFGEIRLLGCLERLASFISLIWKIKMNKKKFVALFGDIRLDDCLCVGMKSGQISDSTNDNLCDIKTGTEVLAREGEDEGEERGDVWRDKVVGLFGEISFFYMLNMENQDEQEEVHWVDWRYKVG